jgi:hypothetical protein
MASIGGDDQITVLPYLDPDLLHDNPKPFFGYSDNTNLLAYLWNLGVVSYHGGSVAAVRPRVRRLGSRPRAKLCVTDIPRSAGVAPIGDDGRHGGAEAGGGPHPGRTRR